MSRLLFLKLGGSLITNKKTQASAREDVIRRVAREVKLALTEQDGLALLIGHGSGSFGHYAAERLRFAYQVQTQWEGFVEIGAAAARLNRIVVDIFLAEGVPVFSIQPSAGASCRAGELVHLSVEAIREVIEQACVPVVYGDVSLDEAFGWTIISTEQILAHLSQVLKPGRIILAGEVAGVYTGNPSTDPDASLIPEITPASFEAVRAGLTGADGFDVTGGMLGKVTGMVELVRAQPILEVHIISGLEPGHVYEALSAPGGRLPARKTVIRA